MSRGFGAENKKARQGGLLKIGGGKRGRTADLRNAIASLYQLSYTPTEDKCFDSLYQNTITIHNKKNNASKKIFFSCLLGDFSIC